MFPLQLRSVEELPLGTRPLAYGCRGGDVRALQLALQEAGYGLEADGFYGYITEAAVRRFQFRFGLSPDGVAGPGTLARLSAFGAGQGCALHRARPGETAAGIARLLGVDEEALRRWNGLRKSEAIIPGRLLAVPRRTILLLPGEKPLASLAYTLAMGPRLDLFRPGGKEGEGGGGLPVLAADEAAWQESLDRPSRRAETAAFLRESARRPETRAVAVEIPPRLWLRRRRLLAFLAHLCEEGGPALCPLVYPPEADGPWPDLPGLARLSDRLLFDPGVASFDLGSLARLLRRVCRRLPPDRLLVVLRGGGLLSPAKGPEEILSARKARAEAIAARARWIRDEGAGVLRAVSGRDGEPGWSLSLLDERGLRLRVRLAARMGLAGVVLGGLAGLLPPCRNEGPWPGEFAVADNFLPAPHID